MRDAASSLWKSRKFLLLLLDTAVSLITFFVGKYATPATAQDLLFLIGALQPVFVSIIASIAYEDGQALRANQTYRDTTPAPPSQGVYSGANSGLYVGTAVTEPSTSTAYVAGGTPTQ